MEENEEKKLDKGQNGFIYRGQQTSETRTAD